MPARASARLTACWLVQACRTRSTGWKSLWWLGGLRQRQPRRSTNGESGSRRAVSVRSALVPVHTCPTLLIREHLQSTRAAAAAGAPCYGIDRRDRRLGCGSCGGRASTAAAHQLSCRRAALHALLRALPSPGRCSGGGCRRRRQSRDSPVGNHGASNAGCTTCRPTTPPPSTSTTMRPRCRTGSASCRRVCRNAGRVTAPQVPRLSCGLFRRTKYLKWWRRRRQARVEPRRRSDGHPPLGAPWTSTSPGCGACPSPAFV